MTFADLPAGSAIFLDANPLVYHFAPDPILAAPCSQLLARIQNQEIQASTSTHVLSEAAHHRMTLEASTLFGWTSKVVQHLKHQPTAIQQLSAFRQAIEKIPQLGLQVLTVPPDLIATAAGLSQQ